MNTPTSAHFRLLPDNDNNNPHYYPEYLNNNVYDVNNVLMLSKVAKAVWIVASETTYCYFLVPRYSVFALEPD